MLARASATALLAFVLVAGACRQGDAPEPVAAMGQSQPVPHASIPDVAERVVPSVVNVSAVLSRPLDSDDPLFSDPLFRRFFGDPREGPDGPHGPFGPDQQAVGSGVIVDSDGIILTSSHIVNEADEVRVSLADGRELDAEVVGADPQSDLAVLRLLNPPSDLRALPMGDSSELRLGETVLAVGNPFGVGKTVTMGIVSATGRTGMGIVDYEDFIQTDAAINPGNSGGALVNLRGELVGINTAILSHTGGYQGIGFAIPVSMARVIMRDLIEDGEVNRGFLGVRIQDVTRDLARAMDLPTERGALIAEVVPGGPADRAGLRPGDVVLAVDGRQLRSGAELRNLVALEGGGNQVTLRVWRDGDERELRIRLSALEPEEPPEPPAPREPASEETANLEGLELRDLDARARQRLDLPPSLEGVIVTRVDPGTDAARAGLQPGDVIVQLDRRPVTSVRELTDRYLAGEGAALLLVQRQDARLFMAMPRA